MFALILHLTLRPEYGVTLTPSERETLCRDLTNEGMKRLHVKGYAHVSHAQVAYEGMSLVKLVAVFGMSSVIFTNLPALEEVQHTLTAYLEQQRQMHIKHITATYRPIQGLWEVACLVDDVWDAQTNG